MKLIQQGDRKAKIVLVGEAPGDTEMATGVPFSGSSGELLNKMLSNAGILRSECFVTNLCHIQPQGKKKNDFDWFVTPEGLPYLTHGVFQLKKDLEEIRPNVIVALGAQPLRVLTQKIGIDKYRGSILPSTLVPGLKVIATYHPAFIIRSWDYKAVAELDLGRVRSDSYSPDIAYPARELYLHTSGITRRVGVDWVHSEEGYNRQAIIAEMLMAQWLAIDIECYERPDGTWQLACVGFSDRPDRSLVIANLSASDFQDIKLLCESEGPDKVLQNGQFDTSVLAKEGIHVRGYGEVLRDRQGSIIRVRGWDTMYAQHALYPECAGSEEETTKLHKGTRKSAAIKKGLGFLTSTNTREPFYKDDGKLWKEEGDVRLFWRYNALDAAVTREIRDVQEGDLTAFGTLHTFQHEMSLVRTLMDCTNRGFRVDLDLRQRMRAELDQEISNLQVFLDSGAGRHINVFSNGINGDVGKLVYGTLGLPVKRNRDSGNPTLDKNALADLAEKHPNPLLRCILSIRERRKIVETYLETPLGTDGRLRCLFDPSGTRTGRLSSRSSLDDSGQNLQNQPLKVRRYFISDPGKIFIYRDFSQAEARVVAYLARCQYLIDIFEDPDRDIHKENAQRIFGIPIADVTHEQRFIAKKGVHSANYGVGAEKSALFANAEARDTWGKPGTGIIVSTSDMRRVLDTYFMLAPEIKGVFWHEVRQELNRTRTLTTLFGRKRTFFGRWEASDDSKFLNAAYSYKPQGTVGELCTRAMVEIDYLFQHENLPAQLMVNVHDSLLAQCDDNPSTVEEVAHTMEQGMRIPIECFGRTFYIPTDCKVGYNWADRGKDGSNPRGLVDIKKYLDSHVKTSVLVTTQISPEG